MVTHAKILRAICNGLNEAIAQFDFDDFDFNDDKDITLNKIKSSSIARSKVVQSEWIYKNFVDLGLPSGTLWCKWNIGASNGNTPESWYGNYYAWGETETKDIYNEDNYTYTENQKILPLDRDVAYLTNNLMRMPSLEQLKELKALPNEWVNNYNGIEGLNGRAFIGTNGNKLFIPAAGSEEHAYNSYCNIWSSHLYDAGIPYYANSLCFTSDDIKIGGYKRFRGYTIRPVLLKQ